MTVKLESLWGKVAWRLVGTWIITICLGVLLHQVETAPSSAQVPLGVLATVLGLLAAGIYTAYSSLSMADGPPGSIGFYNVIITIVFCCIYILLYLSLFCLYRLGVKTVIGNSLEIVLHIGVGSLLSAMHCIDVWDRAQAQVAAASDKKPSMEEGEEQEVAQPLEQTDL